MKKIGEYRKDLILILVLLAGAGLIAGAFALAKKPGAFVRVEQNGQLLAVYPLAEDRREVFPAEEAAEGNVLVISGGAVHMESASCPDRLCVKQGEKSRAGDTIICLPHKLAVTVISREEAEGLLP
ncbi:MAG: NusG domain II-containing protein [Lachnospiraceae bacterium]|nr:NusG domain II-containing protein [Lachnospiraceae bacterium]